ncbi:MAG TPA: DUF4838 domain-containing protein [Candidatus Hydrogenedentes bacterium]|nr:DUF4838 domain-containing protein [Candidatus Hydrogenedentota bacterium]HQE82729.1 DUF4838 domain-containing protein [Candidatus Hydrogenedentota bacterium]HQH51704.1 DUF4838 domain-containing protein [Candidatus Hydrogenedentota bacterium]HQM47205.1 DUF4838 domain-containing protein [Candidatus Hydrogenedentota bacterium]
MVFSKLPKLISIRVASEHPAVDLAAEELTQYLERLTGSYAAVNNGAAESLALGLMADFPEISAPGVADPDLDDAIHIDTTGATGIIAGINPRSVLLAVYRYLTELGCRWVRPGDDGAYAPKLDELRDVRVSETPSCRHRAVCIEGAVSYEHVRDMVDWLPKLGFNGYFIQFREGHTFFDRWYRHTGNPNRQGAPLSIPKAREYTALLEHEIKRRGLLYHKVGHGWTCEPFGIPGLGWDKQARSAPPDVAKYLAEVNGKRDFWKGVALDTNLCYSNPEVRRMVVDAVVAYARDHPNIDYLHFWLADGTNNNCECAECARARPSDFYVMMLNELDGRLSEAGLKTRIVFLIYVDLLWPPVKEKFENPDRFVLMFAPIVRTYSETFEASETLPELPPFERNKLEFPKSVDDNVAFLKAWQEMFDGDSFDFDYHLMWDHSNDPGHMQISRTIAEDMKGLAKIGLNGYVSCQIQRIFLPTGLAMTAMGQTLWNAAADFDILADDYFASAFGTDGAACRDYLERLTELFDPVYIRGEKGWADPEQAQRFAKVPGLIQSFMPVIDANLDSDAPCHRASWFYLKHHAQLALGLARAFHAKALGQDHEARREWESTKQLAWDKEPALHPVLDTWLFAMTALEAKFVPGKGDGAPA